MRVRLGLLLVVTTASGFAGLAYEVLWMRLLATVVGNSQHAAAAVLCAVMGGFGVGSAAGGWLVDRLRPLRAYALMEAGLLVCALVVPLFARSALHWVPPLLGPFLGSHALFLIRFAIAGMLVFVPACLMGATLPALVRAHTGDMATLGPVTALVYAANTAGAAMGAVLTGYVFLGAVGILSTSRALAAVNAGCALSALLLSRWTPSPVSAEPASTASDSFLYAILAWIVGAALLGFEVLWTRVLLIVFGHDVHAFSSMLASVLLGLALGAGAYRALPERVRTFRFLVPVLLLLLGVSALLSLALVGHLYVTRGIDLFGASAHVNLARSHERGLVLEGIFTLVLVLLPAIASGATLPALITLCRRGGAGARVGRVFAANTFGAVLGALMTPLALVPTLGISGAFAFLGAAVLGGAILFLALAHRLLPSPGTAAMRCGLAAVLVCLFLASAVILPGALVRKMLAAKIGSAHQDITYYVEGRGGTVSVVRNRINGERQLFVNGINEVTTRLVHDQSFKLLGHLGLLLHPDPRDVGVVCLGAGLSAGAAATHADVRRIDIVDLMPAVEGGARRFDDLNHRVLADPRVRLIVDDGRAYLAATKGRYDVLIVDSTHPRAVDSWILHTREFYDVAASRLSEDGVIVQWLPLHGLSVDEFRILVRTFHASFPGATLWANAGFERYGAVAYALLVGRPAPGPIDLEAMADRLARPGVRRDLETYGLARIEDVLACYLAGPAVLARWTDGVPINTDDLPFTQFVTRYSRGAPMTPGRLLELEGDPALSPRLTPEREASLARSRRAQRFLLAGKLERAERVCAGACPALPLYASEVREAVPYYRKLGALYRGDPARTIESAAGLVRFGAGDEAVSLLEAACKRVRRADLALHLGLARFGAGNIRGALAAYDRARARAPKLLLAHLARGRALLSSGRHDEAVQAFERAVALEPDVAAAHAALGFALLHRRGEGARAERHLREALALDPRNHEARVALGRLLLREARLREAVSCLETGARHYPLDGDVLFNLGMARARRGDRASAMRAFSRALHVNPDDAEAAAELARLQAGSW